MRNIILFTVLLFITAITVTGFYFSKLTFPGQTTADVLSQIPADAALVFEFKNDPEFYKLFHENKLLTSFIGQKKTNELHYLYNQFLEQAIIKSTFNNRSIYISLHPELKSNEIDMLLSVNADGITDLQKLLEQIIIKTGAALEAEKIGTKTIQIITFPAIKEVFYLTENAGVLAGSFNKDLLFEFLDGRKENKVNNLAQLSNQQNKNSIADLYVNYQQFPVLFKQLFRNQNDDFFRFLNGFPATATLSLNYKKDALLFNGYTKADTSAAAYLNLFLNQQPEKNSIKTVFPNNTAFAISFACSLPAEFLKALGQWQVQKKLLSKAKALFAQIKSETGIMILPSFRGQLDKEFAIITTDRNEKLAIIKLKNGSELEPFLRNISINPDSNQNQFKYQNLPYYLLGEPLLHFKQPYFKVIDNYLFLANSQASLNQYLDNYHQQNFLSNNQQYYHFDALLAEQSNVTFFVHLPNADPILNNFLQSKFAKLFDEKTSGWKNFYAAALQYTASDHQFYTNFYLQEKENKPVEKDSIASKPESNLP